MTMTWQDYIYIRCAISLVGILALAIYFVIAYSRDKKKKDNNPANKDISNWRELK